MCPPTQHFASNSFSGKLPLSSVDTLIFGGCNCYAIAQRQENKRHTDCLNEIGVMRARQADIGIEECPPDS